MSTSGSFWILILIQSFWHRVYKGASSRDVPELGRPRGCRTSVPQQTGDVLPPHHTWGSEIDQMYMYKICKLLSLLQVFTYILYFKLISLGRCCDVVEPLFEIHRAVNLTFCRRSLRRKCWCSRHSSQWLVCSRPSTASRSRRAQEPQADVSVPSGALSVAAGTPSWHKPLYWTLDPRHWVLIQIRPMV